MCMPSAHGSQKSQSPRTGVTGGYEPQHGC